MTLRRNNRCFANRLVNSKLEVAKGRKDSLCAVEQWVAGALANIPLAMSPTDAGSTLLKRYRLIARGVGFASDLSIGELGNLREAGMSRTHCETANKAFSWNGWQFRAL